MNEILNIGFDKKTRRFGYHREEDGSNGEIKNGV